MYDYLIIPDFLLKRVLDVYSYPTARKLAIQKHTELLIRYWYSFKILVN